MGIIYALGSVSGAHFNPAITFAFAIRRVFSWVRLPGYIVAQVIGAFCAVFLLKMFFGSGEHLGATLPHVTVFPSFILETILSTLLITVIIGTATGSKLVGNNAGMAVGATIILCGLIADPVSGASLNPA